MKKMVILQAPRSEEELLERARAIAGLSLAEIAQRQQLAIPIKLLHAKGWVGQLIEQALGATAGVKAEPDFQAIGVELKTIPLAEDGNPKESTYISIVPMLDTAGLTWKDSAVYKKLKRVLWLPFEAESSLQIAERRVGMPLLWSPSPKQEKILQQDWEELMEMVSLGLVANITAHHGTYLQIRPKAANNKALRDAIDEEGKKFKTLPKGFYLRVSFTKQILTENYI